ncbi:MAG: 30S ribosomal protein S20 [Pseudomonadota bacterium]
MATTKSAEKKIRQAARRTIVNRARLSQVHTAVKKVEAAIAAGHKDEARVAYKSAAPVLMRGVGTGTIHKNAVARKLSRLSRRIKTL